MIQIMTRWWEHCWINSPDWNEHSRKSWKYLPIICALFGYSSLCTKTLLSIQILDWRNAVNFLRLIHTWSGPFDSMRSNSTNRGTTPVCMTSSIGGFGSGKHTVNYFILNHENNIINSVLVRLHSKWDLIPSKDNLDSRLQSLFRLVDKLSGIWRTSSDCCIDDCEVSKRSEKCKCKSLSEWSQFI